MQKSTPATTEGLLGKLTIIGIVLWRYWSDVNSANSLCLTTSKHTCICSYNTIIITQSIYIYIFPTHHFNQQWFLHWPFPSQSSHFLSWFRCLCLFSFALQNSLFIVHIQLICILRYFTLSVCWFVTAHLTLTQSTSPLLYFLDFSGLVGLYFSCASAAT